MSTRLGAASGGVGTGGHHGSDVRQSSPILPPNEILPMRTPPGAGTGREHGTDGPVGVARKPCTPSRRNVGRCSPGPRTVAFGGARYLVRHCRPTPGPSSLPRSTVPAPTGCMRCPLAPALSVVILPLNADVGDI